MIVKSSRTFVWTFSDRGLSAGEENLAHAEHAEENHLLHAERQEQEPVAGGHRRSRFTEVLQVLSTVSSPRHDPPADMQHLFEKDVVQFS